MIDMTWCVKTTSSAWPSGLITVTCTSPLPALNVSTVNRAGAPAQGPLGSRPINTPHAHAYLKMTHKGMVLVLVLVSKSFGALTANCQNNQLGPNYWTGRVHGILIHIRVLISQQKGLISFNCQPPIQLFPSYASTQNRHNANTQQGHSNS